MQEQNLASAAKERIKILVGLWQQRGLNQKELVAKMNLFAHNRGVKGSVISTPGLSKILNDYEVSLTVLNKLLRCLEEMEQAGDADFVPKTNGKSPFGIIAGHYMMCHQSYRSKSLLLNLLEIKHDGSLYLHSEIGKTHHGQAFIFQNSMVALNFHSIDDKPFYYQVIFNLKGYIDYGLAKVRHIWAASTTVSLEMVPTLNLRLLFPLKKTETLPEPGVLALKGEGFEQLAAEYPALHVFNRSHRPTRLICPFEVNEIPY